MEITKKDPRLEVAFGSIWTTLNTRRQEVDATSHDITTKEGKAAAVTLCTSLRKERKHITEAHTKAKAGARKFGLLVDEQKNLAEALLDETIAIYADPLQAMKDAEAERVAGIQGLIASMKVGPDVVALASADILAKRDAIAAVIVGDDFAEFADEAVIVKTAALRCLDEASEQAVKRESEALELIESRRKIAEQEQKLREQAAAEAARVQATNEAAAKVKAAEDALRALEDRRKRQAAEMEARETKAKEALAARLSVEQERKERQQASSEAKKAAMVDEVGAYLGEAEAIALYNGIVTGNITTLVMA